MRLIQRYLLAAALMACRERRAMAQVRDDRYPAVTGTIPPAALAPCRARRNGAASRAPPAIPA